MIGIVIVSHSRKLSDGLKELADAMSGQPVPIASAGGLDEPGDPLGTDGIRVLDAIRSVYSEDGVLIFADIGSARLNAEMAMDLLEECEQAHVRYCDAPLVEGVLAAAVQIASGGGLDMVIREAREAGSQKTGLNEETDLSAADETPSGAVTREFVIRNALGLHARPAAQLVTAMNAFPGTIRLTNLTKGRSDVNAKSINSVILSKVSGGDRISISADAHDADAVFAAVDRLIEANFGEDGVAASSPGPVRSPAPEPDGSAEASAPQAPVRAPAGPEEDGQLTGLAIAPGFALGPLHHLRRQLPEIEPAAIEDTDAETARFEKALADAEADIRASLAQAGQRLSEYDRTIFDAHISYLHDPDLITGVRERIAAEKICAEAVWRRTVADLAETYAALDDPVLRARAADVIDVGLRVLGFLTGKADGLGDIGHPAILAFDDLRPSDVLALDEAKVLGICTVAGGRTSHAAILASALKVPVVFALGDALASVGEGVEVLLDGVNARLVVRPERAAIETMKRDRAERQERQAQAEAVKMLPAETRDGYRLRAAANMASLEELGRIAASGAEEIGLLRTEFLYMRRDTAPGEDEQYRIYKAIVSGLEGRPLTVRTADIGGDKPVPYMDRPPEANPNLGWRGLRYSLSEPDLFDTQLAAILRASAHGPVRLMFPLVSTVAEVRAARERVRVVMKQLEERGEAFDASLQTGLMIEVPAAAEMADLLACEVDFFSIGTNDLTQYVMAADRGHPKLQALFDPFNPAVLRMIARTIRAAKTGNIWTGMCGAMAGDPLAAPILIGLGLDEFSMTPGAIADFKLAVRNLDRVACEGLAGEVLALASAEAVRERASEFLER